MTCKVIHILFWKSKSMDLLAYALIMWFCVSMWELFKDLVWDEGKSDGGLHHQSVLPLKAEQPNAHVVVSLLTQDFHVGRWTRNVGESRENQFCTSTHNNDIALKMAFAESEVCWNHTSCQYSELMMYFITKIYLCYSNWMLVHSLYYMLMECHLHSQDKHFFYASTRCFTFAGSEM